MVNKGPFTSWKEIPSMRRSRFFRGHTSDYYFDQSRNAYLAPSSEGLFTHSNARILLGQAANGSLRMIALPTQVYPAPTGMGEFGLGPGMYHHFDVVMYAGNLSYRIQLDGSVQGIDLAVPEKATETVENETWYAEDFLPSHECRNERRLGNSPGQPRAGCDGCCGSTALPRAASRTGRCAVLDAHSQPQYTKAAGEGYPVRGRDAGGPL